MFGRVKPYHVQPMVQEFAEDCATLHAAAFPHPWAAPEFERLIGAVASVGEAAVETRSRKLLGFILSRRAADEAEVLTVAVEAAARGQGVANKILSVHLPRLRRFGVRTVFLEVGDTNTPALQLYRRFGFVEAGRRAGYYRTADGDRAAALVMRCDLPPRA